MLLSYLRVPKIFISIQLLSYLDLLYHNSRQQASVILSIENLTIIYYIINYGSPGFCPHSSWWAPFWAAFRVLPLLFYLMPLGLLKTALRTPAGLCLGGCGISCIGNFKKILALFFTRSGFDHAVSYTVKGECFLLCLGLWYRPKRYTFLFYCFNRPLML